MPHANVVCESLRVRRQNRFIRRLLPVIRVCVPGAGTERSPRAAPISGIRDLQLLLGNILRRRSGLGRGVQRSRQHRPTACRASGGEIHRSPVLVPGDDFVVMGILGRWIVIRTESSTKIVASRRATKQTYAGSPPSVRVRRRVSRRSSKTVPLCAADFQPIPLGSTQGESRAPADAARVSCDSSFQDANRSRRKSASDTPFHLCVAPPEDLRQNQRTLRPCARVRALSLRAPAEDRRRRNEQPFRAYADSNAA